MKTMIAAIAFTAYPVSDMPHAKTCCYAGILGLKETYNYQEQWVEYDIGSGTLALTTMASGQQPGARGAEVGFEIEHLDDFVRTLKAKAVPFVTDVFETPVCRIAVIRDPDNNHLVLHQRPVVPCRI